jgi:hypothetical protein
MPLEMRIRGKAILARFQWHALSPPRQSELLKFE